MPLSLRSLYTRCATHCTHSLSLSLTHSLFAHYSRIVLPQNTEFHIDKHLNGGLVRRS